MLEEQIKSYTSNSLYRKFREYFPVLLIILISANVANILHNKLFIIGLFLVSWFIFLIKRYRIHKVFLIIVLVWLIINIVSFFYNQTAKSFFSDTAIKSSIYGLFTSYFLLVFSGKFFFIKLEKLIFILTLISFPFYMAEWALPSIMNSIPSPIPCLRGDTGSWYIGIYYHLLNFTGNIKDSRNSGFMWEPGAFAFMIILGIVINFRQKGIKLDRRFIVYTVAMLTTLSTMGYLVIILLFGIMLRKVKRIISIPLLSVFIFIFPIFLQLDFIAPEIEQHIQVGEDNKVYRSDRVGILRINRYAALLLAINETYYLPTGYGIIKSKQILGRYGEMIAGVGAFQYTLIRWGWGGLVFMIISLKKTIVKMNIGRKQDKISILVMLIAILMGLFSNPLESSPIFYAIVFYSFFYKTPFNKNTAIT